MASRTMIRALAQHVAKLMADDRATDPKFFEMLAEELNRLGYRIEAYQRGISGTYVCVVKVTD